MFYNGMNFIGQFQYHEFDASFDTDLWDGTMHISFYTVQLGIAYIL